MKKETLKKAYKLNEDIYKVEEMVKMLKEKDVTVFFQGAGGSPRKGLPSRFNEVIVAATKELLEGYLEDLQKEFDEL